MLSRRALGVGAMGLSLGGFPAWAATGDTQHAAMLQGFAEAFLRRSPEEATGVGFDTAAEVGLRSRLDDRSLAARSIDRAAVAQARALLAAFERASLGPAAQRDHDVARFVCDTLADLLARPGYVDINLRPSPYVVSQMNGAYFWLPDFIGARHPLATSADGKAWLARLAAFAVAIDQESERIVHDAAQGVVPPDFIITRTLTQLKALRDTPPLVSALIAPALARAAARGLPDMSGPAEAVFRQQIAPALDRQMAALQAVAPHAVAIPGVWRLPDGDGYYAAALKANTTAQFDPADLHQEGLAQCAALSAEIATLLAGQGLTSGSIGDRIAALDADPRFMMSNDDAGRSRIMRAAESALAKVIERLPRAFGAISVDPVGIRRIPVAVEAGAPGAFYSDGAKGEPGVISLNLKTPAEHPLWRLPTLIHHEGVPGHHFQYSVLGAAGDVSLFRRIVRFSAYTEGWALYAEQVAAEIGVYDDDPFGRIGMLQSQLFRAARIVVDTGLHHKRWSLAQAVDWMVTNAFEQPTSSLREVVRYSVYPGQACSFKVGANRINHARSVAQAAMGARFRMQDFHDLVLKAGPVPLTVLEGAVAQWAGA
jgi:uncharacterized protein (DUF885 family)